MNNLKMPVSELNRVGKTTENQLKKIGIKTIRDLLAHYPFRYEDYSQILTIEEFKTQKTGTIKVKVNLIANRRFYRKKMILTEAIVSDKTGSLQVVWFNQGFLTKTIKPGQEIYLAGKIDNANHGLQLINPSYEICTSRKPIHTGGLIPIYSTTARLTQKQIRFLISQALKISSDIKDWLPLPIKNQHQLVNLDFAIKQIHFPENKKTLKQAQQRLKFNELFLLQLKNQIIREKIKKEKAPSIEFKLKETKKFVKNLPFKLTNEQRKASWEIINDLEKENRMNRLLEGDVGSGKTIVAIMSCLNVVLNNYQVAYMVPTEILAKQQFQNISNLLQKFQIKIGLLTRTNAFVYNPKSQKNIKITKQNLLKKISNGEIRIIVSTHSIIGPKVRFKNLGLTIVDEQHRFGVKQRYSLTKLRNENNLSAHFLSLTATPIPRSVALTLYGDLDLSIIGKMPPGRKKIVTKIIEPEQKIDTYQFIKKEIKKGRQAFVICPLIDPSTSLIYNYNQDNKLGTKSVKEEYRKLSQDIFPDIKIGFIHGKLKNEEKQKIMEGFVSQEIKILVSTTVIEVGIDIPNATIMIIKGAERFGLAQLYQLRGRIGRGSNQSYCFLFVENEGPKTKKRLEALLKAKNGFELAQKDLELRGPGEFFNTEQSGFMGSLKIAKLTDIELMQKTRLAAIKTIKDYPDLIKKIKKSINITHLE
ncbi:hypothetical protein B6D52_00500 [Candidatus Parcubacteria bacterium 4484_255]|nr:MAG: hypothetical protein B6D52_00500 [Candidatus Parcubacteria bacterium 4484_255]